MASLVWSGGSVAGKWESTPAGRFKDFAPAANVIGQRRTLLANGAPRVWAYRSDFTASFTLTDIPNTAIEDCVALALHLSGGGTVEVHTDDAAGRVYTNCVLAPGAETPQPTLSDAPMLRYAMSFALLNLDGAPLVAIYA